MSIFLILNVILVISIIIYLPKIWDFGNTYGKLIVKLRSRKGLMIFYTIFLIFWINNLVSYIKDYIAMDKYRDFSMIVLSIMWILICLINLLRSIKYSEIREKGIYLQSGFYDWSRIYCYEWISSDTIKFNAKRLTFGDFEEKVEVYYDDKEKVEEILRKYIELCSPNSSYDFWK